MPICETCLHREACGKYKATGGVNRCENHKEERHGRWISWEAADNFIPSPDRHECSVCHDAAQVLVNGLELLSPYCPNCGTPMDGGETDG